ncbi:ZPR1 zinc-finger domain-containing protein [Crassisporium funariophilum]|nr:ZPR1 zinc-finger domain-containing protein [Crassisporium funariophilum]
MSNALFPSIGSVADTADKLESKDAVLEKGTEGEAGASQNEDKVVDEIDSLCMECREQGVTRLLLTSIPFFQEVIVMSFRCEHCGFTNNEIQSAGAVRPEGTIYTLRVLNRKDLNRQLVRSPSCEILIPQLDLTLPPTSRGQLTTVEGLLRDVKSDLGGDQPLRKIQDPDGWTKIEAILDKLKAILGDNDDEDDEDAEKTEKKELPPMPSFTLKLDDPAGNSFIEFVDSMADPKWNLRTYPRTLEHNIALGLVSADDAAARMAGARQAAVAETPEGAVMADGSVRPITDDEIFVFPGTCSSCGHPIETNMKKVNIPYFKDILIMSTNCDRCGYRDNEVKSGSAISAQGKRITLKVEDREDLSRDILKSETAGLTIPEIDLVLNHGTLGGRFTTLEGILDQVYEELSDKVFASGDSSIKEDKTKFEVFLTSLKAVKNAERPFTIILDDPLANSYIQNLYAPDPDPGLEIEMYDRTFDQNEELGLNDIKVEGYEADAEEKTGEEAKEEKVDVPQP